MKHYTCDGCKKEIPSEDSRFKLTVTDMQGMVVENLDVCSSCYILVTDAMKKANKETGP